MTTITDYIKNNEKLNKLDYLTVFTTIEQLVKDGYILQSVER